MAVALCSKATRERLVRELRRDVFHPLPNELTEPRAAQAVAWFAALLREVVTRQLADSPDPLLVQDADAIAYCPRCEAQFVRTGHCPTCGLALVPFNSAAPTIR